jgi:hypothetical protein
MTETEYADTLVDTLVTVYGIKEARRIIREWFNTSTADFRKNPSADNFKSLQRTMYSYQRVTKNRS